MGSQVIEALIWSSRDALLDALQKGGDPNAVEGGSSALAIACTQDREDLAGDLLRHGARVNATEEDGSTPVFVAAGSGSEALTRLLLDAGADVNITNDIGQTPLMVGAKSGSTEVVKALLTSRADSRARDRRGLNALHWAATDGDFPDVVRLLLAAGTSPDDRTVSGRTVLDYAVSLNRRQMIAALSG